MVKFISTGTDIDGSRCYNLMTNSTKIGSCYAKVGTNRTGLAKVRGTVYYATAFGQTFSGSRATIVRLLDAAIRGVA